MNNDEVMRHLLTHARKLDGEGGALFQVRAFRSAALIIQGLPRPVEEILAEHGRKGLESIPGIGKSIAYAVEQLLGIGEMRVLRPPHLPAREQLRSLPGVGPRAAERLQDEEGLASVSEVRRAGRLAEMRRAMEDEPSIEEILAVEADFRRLAGAGVLGRTAPRAYSPKGPKWEGVLQCERGGWHLRVAWADTAIAHRLDKTRDWIEVRFERDGRSGVRTVVTEAGRRVVRGREEEGCGTAA
jgi:hypothetical protein